MKSNKTYKIAWWCLCAIGFIILAVAANNTFEWYGLAR